MQFTNLLPKTAQRVPRHTSSRINKEIHKKTRSAVRRSAAAGPEAVEQRIGELDREWDIERALEANAAALAYLGVMMSLRDRRWLVLPSAVAAFLFQHALQGWCPPLPVFRRLGFRTQSEIEYERYALKAIRGDFNKLSGKKKGQININQALKAAENRENGAPS